jgi:hypothetical protein
MLVQVYNDKKGEWKVVEVMGCAIMGVLNEVIKWKRVKKAFVRWM